MISATLVNASLTKISAMQRKRLRFQIFSIHLCYIRHTTLIFKISKYISEAVVRSALKRGALKILAKSFKNIYQGINFLSGRSVKALLKVNSATGFPQRFCLNFE